MKSVQVKAKMNDSWTHVLTYSRITGRKPQKAVKHENYWVGERDTFVSKWDFKEAIPIDQFEWPYDPVIDFPENLEETHKCLGYMKMIRSNWGGYGWEYYRANSEEANACRGYAKHFFKELELPSYRANNPTVWCQEDGYIFRIDMACWNEANVYVFEPREYATLREEVLAEAKK